MLLYKKKSYIEIKKIYIMLQKLILKTLMESWTVEPIQIHPRSMNFWQQSIPPIYHQYKSSIWDMIWDKRDVSSCNFNTNIECMHPQPNEGQCFWKLNQRIIAQTILQMTTTWSVHDVYDLQPFRAWKIGAHRDHDELAHGFQNLDLRTLSTHATSSKIQVGVFALISVPRHQLSQFHWNGASELKKIAP